MTQCLLQTLEEGARRTSTTTAMGCWRPREASTRPTTSGGGLGGRLRDEEAEVLQLLAAVLRPAPVIPVTTTSGPGLLPVVVSSRWIPGASALPRLSSGYVDVISPVAVSTLTVCGRLWPRVEGLLPPGDHVILDRHSTDGIMALGGTIIGTTNRGHFIAKIGAGDRAVVAADVIEKARAVLNELGVNALIIVGGDGSMTTALQLQEAGINCIGVPKTIDNDLEATAMTFGFDQRSRW